MMKSKSDEMQPISGRKNHRCECIRIMPRHFWQCKCMQNDAIAFFAMHKKEKENEIEKENEKESEKESEKENENEKEKEKEKESSCCC